MGEGGNPIFQAALTLARWSGGGGVCPQQQQPATAFLPPFLKYLRVLQMNDRSMWPIIQLEGPLNLAGEGREVAIDC